MTRRTICIIAFSPIARDARVLRQIKYLAPTYDLIVLGQGAAPAEWAEHPAVTWIRVDVRRRRAVALLRLPLLLLSRFGGSFFDAWYWSARAYRDAYVAADRAVPRDLAAVHANDWNTMPIALRLARNSHAKVVLDLHEYAPLEYEERPFWSLLYRKPIAGLLRRTAGEVAASITVAPAIADRYLREVGLSPIVVLNTPDAEELPDHAVDPEHIRLVHHGAAQRGRGLELTIEAIALAANRFTLDLVLVGDPGYIQRLKGLASALAPGRIQFREPVPPTEVVRTLAGYDLGIFLLPPSGYSKAQALPNKMFDFLSAGLGIVTGPTPAMSDLVKALGIGIVTPSFSPGDVAASLDGLGAPRVEDLRSAARSTRSEYTAEVEMRKVVRLYEALLGPGNRGG